MINIKNAKAFSDLYEHEKMLADMVRVSNYYKAIKRYIKEGDVVIDLGTGTGILSFFSAQQKPSKIYAIDHSNFIDVAKIIAEHNDMTNVQFVRINSRNFTSKEKVDVILHEQMGDNLFDENMIENILDLKQRLLKSTGRIMPGKFEVFLEPVCIKKDYKVPFLWENHINGVDFDFIKNMSLIDKYKSADYTIKWLENSAFDYFMCDPKPILSFDLNYLKSKNDIPKIINISKKVIYSGMMDGLCFYFRVIFDEEINFGTSPLHTNTHWGNRLFRLESRHIEIGEDISYKLIMKDTLNIKTWSVTINDN